LFFSLIGDHLWQRFQLYKETCFVDMFTFNPLNISCTNCPYFLPIVIFTFVTLCIFFQLEAQNLAYCSISSRNFVCQMLVVNTFRYAPIYTHTAGSMCLLPIITCVSPQLVIMRFLKCPSIRCRFVLLIELVIFPSIRATSESLSLNLN